MKGRQVLAQNPKRIDKEFLLQFPGFKEFLQRSSDGERLRRPQLPTLEELNLDEAGSALPPDERIDHAAAEIEAALRDELLDRIFAIEPVALRAAFFRAACNPASRRYGIRRWNEGDGPSSRSQRGWRRRWRDPT